MSVSTSRAAHRPGVAFSLAHSPSFATRLAVEPANAGSRFAFEECCRTAFGARHHRRSVDAGSGASFAIQAPLASDLARPHGVKVPLAMQDDTIPLNAKFAGVSVNHGNTASAIAQGPHQQRFAGAVSRVNNARVQCHSSSHSKTRAQRQDLTGEGFAPPAPWLSAQTHGDAAVSDGRRNVLSAGTRTAVNTSRKSPGPI